MSGRRCRFFQGTFLSSSPHSNHAVPTLRSQKRPTLGWFGAPTNRLGRLGPVVLSTPDRSCDKVGRRFGVERYIQNRLVGTLAREVLHRSPAGPLIRRNYAKTMPRYIISFTRNTPAASPKNCGHRISPGRRRMVEYFRHGEKKTSPGRSRSVGGRQKGDGCRIATTRL